MSGDGLPPRLSYSMPPCFRHLDRSLKDRPILRPLSVRGCKDLTVEKFSLESTT